jgi:hypothetical protein
MFGQQRSNFRPDEGVRVRKRSHGAEHRIGFAPLAERQRSVRLGALRARMRKLV